MPLSAMTLTLIVLTLVLLFLALRLVKLVIGNLRAKAGKATHRPDLLMDTLREQTLREQAAVLSRNETVHALEALDELHQTIMVHLPVGVLVLDGTGRIQFANPSLMRLMSLPEISGQSLEEVSLVLFQRLQRFRGDPKIPDEPIREHRHGGRILDVAIRTLPEHRFLMTVVDKTREHELEERLRYRRDMALMGEMASGVTHEVKNSLATIQGHVQMLATGKASDHGRMIQGEIDHLLRFIRQFMRSSQNESLNIERIDVGDWLRNLAAEWQNRPGGDHVRFEIPDSPGLNVEGDSVLLAMVLDNLIRNGLEACGNGIAAEPRVRVYSESQPLKIALVVEDLGPGFADHIRQKLFVPFVSSKEGGTGLGLFHSRKIMMAHGGGLEVDPGPPTRVHCHFPLPQ